MNLRIAAGLIPACILALLTACATTPLGSLAPTTRNDTLFAQVERGMPEPEVARILGRPDETMRFPLSQSEAWDYRYYDAWGYMAIFSVTFGPDRRVASTISNRINAGGDHGSSH